MGLLVVTLGWAGVNYCVLSCTFPAPCSVFCAPFFTPLAPVFATFLLPFFTALPVFFAAFLVSWPASLASCLAVVPASCGGIARSWYAPNANNPTIVTISERRFIPCLLLGLLGIIE